MSWFTASKQRETQEQVLRMCMEQVQDPALQARLAAAKQLDGPQVVNIDIYRAHNYARGADPTPREWVRRIAECSMDQLKKQHPDLQFSLSEHEGGSVPTSQFPVLKKQAAAINQQDEASAYVLTAQPK